MALSRYLFPVLFSLIILGSCKRPNDVHCEIAVLEIHNPDPKRAVVFYWEGSSVMDTILPGESVFTSVNNVHVEYDMMGEVKSTTAPTVRIRYPNGEDNFEVDQCHKVVEATGGFVKPSRHCNDGIYNPEMGENDMDCGGVCNVCGPPLLDCDLVENALKWNEPGLPAHQLYHTILSNYVGIHYQFTLNNAVINAYFHIDELPTQTTLYILGPGEYKAEINYILGSNTYNAIPWQHVYLVKEDNEAWYLEFCDLEFELNTFNAKATAKLALNN